MSNVDLVNYRTGHAAISVPRMVRAWRPHPINNPFNETLLCFEALDGRMWNNERDGSISRSYGNDPELMASLASQGYWQELDV